MYILINAGKATMQELKECYTLDEALKLYAIYSMNMDIEQMTNDELREGAKKR